MNSKRLSSIAAAVGTTALILSFVTVAPAHAVSGATCYSEDIPANTYTLTDNSTIPVPTASSVAKSSIVVGKSSVPVSLSVTDVDDCLGADTLQAVFKTSTGATRYVNLAYNDVKSSIGQNQESIEVWDGAVRFGNLDRGAWYLTQVKLVPVFGYLVFNYATDALVDGSHGVLQPAVTSKVPVSRKITVLAATGSTVDAKPEPILKGKTLTVYAGSVKAYGSAFVANKYAPVLIQYRAPGSSTWKTLKSMTTNSTGRAAAALKPSAKGTWSFRTYTPAHLGFAASISVVDAVAVK